MLSDYMEKAMQHAQYERIEDGTYFATIPGLRAYGRAAKLRRLAEKN